MKKAMAMGFALVLLTVVAVPGLYAQQTGQSDTQAQQSTWTCPRTGEPCPYGGQGRMHRGGRGMRGQRGNCPMAGQNCPYLSQNNTQSGAQSPASTPASSKPSKQ